MIPCSHYKSAQILVVFQNMNEASSLLSATCNTFITTLEECVKIANAKFKPEMFQMPHPDPLVFPVSPSPVQMVGTFSFLSDSLPGFLFCFDFQHGNSNSWVDFVCLYSWFVLDLLS